MKFEINDFEGNIDILLANLIVDRWHTARYWTCIWIEGRQR